MRSKRTIFQTCHVEMLGQDAALQHITMLRALLDVEIDKRNQMVKLTRILNLIHSDLTEVINSLNPCEQEPEKVQVSEVEHPEQSAADGD